jgi:hypothetical protein
VTTAAGGVAVWAFDVDGCLVDSLTGTSLRPLARDVMARLHGTGRSVVVWSAGGRDHAMRKAERLGFADLVDAYYDKESRGSDGRWAVDHLEPQHVPHVFVDDRPEDAPLSGRLVAVPPYLAPDPYDRGLAVLLAELDDERE